MNAERDRLRAIRMFNDLEHVNDLLAYRSMKFKGLDYSVEKELRSLATTIVRKLKPLTERKP